MHINDPKRDTAERVEQLLKLDWPVKEIARTLDVSTQRVYQIISERGLRDKEAAS